jgi:peptidoglycan hydrolase CwlO-like protein
MDEVTQAINRFSVLMEDQNSKLDAVLEAVGDIQAKVANLPTRDEFNELKQDMKVVKAAVTATNRDLKKHKSLSVHVAHGHSR